MLQTLYFKFSGAPESKYIFQRLGAEPWGRWVAGTSELVAATLLLIPRTKLYGAAFSLIIMTGAILSHFCVLGISVEGDGGALFALACIVFTSCLAVLCSAVLYPNKAQQR